MKITRIIAHGHAVSSRIAAKAETTAKLRQEMEDRLYQLRLENIVRQAIFEDRRERAAKEIWYTL